MKKSLIILVFAIIGLTNTVQANYADSLFAEANNSYSQQEYSASIDLYQQIIDTGYTSFELYYNLGNAYYKNGNYSKAILYLEKAKILEPSNEEVNFNLQKANAYTIDRVDIIPELLIVSWMQKFILMFTSNQWSVIALIAFLMALFLMYMYFINGQRNRKVMFFSIATLTILIAVLSFTFSVKTKNYIENSDTAIVMSSTVTVKGSPDDNGVNVFIIHEGTKLRILRSIGNWYEIKLADGKQGWLLDVDVEKI